MSIIYDTVLFLLEYYIFLLILAALPTLIMSYIIFLFFKNKKNKNDPFEEYLENLRDRK